MPLTGRTIDSLERCRDSLIVEILASPSHQQHAPLETTGHDRDEEWLVMGRRPGADAAQASSAATSGFLFKLLRGDSLLDGLVKLDSIKINSEDCIRNVASFSKEKFKKTFMQTVASLLYT